MGHDVRPNFALSFDVLCTSAQGCVIVEISNRSWITYVLKTKTETNNFTDLVRKIESGKFTLNWGQCFRIHKFFNEDLTYLPGGRLF